MTLRPSGRAAFKAALAAFVLHTVVALGVWKTWGEFGRGNVIAWVDFPTSLAYLHLDGTPMLLWSLAAGGLQWAAIAWLLTLSLGWATRAR
jgi:phosphoglycerol transferase MdoB-like AlkP superfamily enzyme